MNKNLRGINKLTATVRFVGRDVPRDIGIQLVAQRIRERCVPGPGGCLLWTGWKNRKGYGETGFHEKNVRTHRIIWEAVNGPIPDGLIVCHTCDMPACNNIEHLWLGTIFENGQDAKAKKRCKNQKIDRCLRGHVFTPENTYMTKAGFRACRTCQRARTRKRAGLSEDAWYAPVGSSARRGGEPHG